MIRLDKMLHACGFGSRKEVKVLIRKQRVTINDEIIKNDDIKVDETKDMDKIINKFFPHQHAELCACLDDEEVYGNRSRTYPWKIFYVGKISNALEFPKLNNCIKHFFQINPHLFFTECAKFAK